MTTTRADNDALEDRLLEFASQCGKVVDALLDTRMVRHVAGQLVRCGTSAAPNCAEAYAAGSRADFIHKLRISLKELHESRVWLKLWVKSQLLPPFRLVPFKDQCTELINIRGMSIVTAKANGTKRIRTPQQE